LIVFENLCSDACSSFYSFVISNLPRLARALYIQSRENQPIVSYLLFILIFGMKDNVCLMSLCQRYKEIKNNLLSMKWLQMPRFVAVVLFSVFRCAWLSDFYSTSISGRGLCKIAGMFSQRFVIGKIILLFGPLSRSHFDKIDSSSHLHTLKQEDHFSISATHQHEQFSFKFKNIKKNSEMITVS
jgi:hypothetical protein